MLQKPEDKIKSIQFGQKENLTKLNGWMSALWLPFVASPHLKNSSTSYLSFYRILPDYPTSSTTTPFTKMHIEIHCATPPLYSVYAHAMKHPTS